MNAAIRSQTDYMPTDIHSLIMQLKTLVEKQTIEMKAALHNIGSYKLEGVFKRYSVSHNKWCSMKVESRDKLFLTMLTDGKDIGKNESQVEKYFPKNVAKKKSQTRVKGKRTNKFF